MNFAEILFAFVVALLLTLLFVPLTSPQQSREGGSVLGPILFFFLILFFASLAGGIWLTPIGPPLWGGFWASFLVVGIFVALLLVAAGDPPRSYRFRTVTPKRMTTAEAETEAVAAAAFGMLFWILILSLVAAVIAGYMTR
jgi:hypothetical protein